MPSSARSAFDENYADVERLIEIHEELAGEGPGYKHQVEVLNKSAVVLTSAVWEAFCEDLASEAVAHLVAEMTDPKQLPKELQKRVAAELASEKHELAVWKLAEGGWRKVLEGRIQDIADERNRELNTPKADNIRDLFERAVGIPDVPSSWSWKGMSAKRAGEKLDEYVSLRGDIAHRSKGGAKISKKTARDFKDHVGHLVAHSDDYVNQQIENTCGVALF